MDIFDQAQIKIDLDASKQDIRELQSQVEGLKNEMIALFDAYIRCEARSLSYKMIIPILFRQNPEQKEAFDVDLESHYNTLYALMKDRMKNENPKTFHKIYGDGQ